jgi:uncharacterized protein (DUF58 family)
MLYPDFSELVALKDLKLDVTRSSSVASHSKILGGQHSPFRGQGLEFDFVRKYVPGDDIRNIDWRVTARTDSPHLKIFKEERERQVLLCIDVNASMRFGTRNTFKSVQAARIAAFLGWRAMADQDRISGCLFGDVPGGISLLAPTRTRKSFSTLLKTLSEPQLEQHQVSLGQVFEHISRAAPTGSLIYFISDFMELFQEEGKIYRLSKRCDLVFISVNDAADQAIFPSGMVPFSSGLEKIQINTDSSSGREAYERQWKENRETLYALTSGLKIPFIELTTESDIQRDLVPGLKRLAKRKSR